jgi:hypothetical protein
MLLSMASRSLSTNFLMPPRVPQLRKAVAKDNERPFAILGEVHPDPVRFDEAVIHFEIVC